MSENTAIEIFLRVRPTKRSFNGLESLKEESKIQITLPKDDSQGYVNNQKLHYDFKFNGVFGMDAKQEDIFEGVAKDVVDSALEGFNGTVFAYGQTGSGKTYTMTGGAERYVDRGIIPRTLSYIFHETRKRTDTFFKISVSYIEIYNNDGYDLLDPNHSTNKLEDLPKVNPREREDGKLVLSGLSAHKAENEEQALNLLFIGETNRAVSETPKNDASTRSHCIFMVNIEGEKTGSEGKKTQSRLYLVDLSGSERVGKTEVGGLLLKEARFINLSLHYLEHVIVCLNKKVRGEQIHIPYRNSLMTMILKDSLGGNSKTRMVATISAEKGDIDESISTCNFAQRVALIKNALSKTELVDPALIIQRLKKENEELRAALALANGGSQKESLEPSDIEECRRIVEDFLTNPDPGAKIILKDMIMISQCFYQLKHKFNDLKHRSEKQAVNASTKKVLDEGLNMDTKQKSAENNAGNQEEVKRLKLLIQQRDNEIAILLNLLNKQKSAGQEDPTLVPVVGAPGNTSLIISENQEAQNYKTMKFPGFDELKQKEAANEKTPLKNNFLQETEKPMDIVQRKLRNDESATKGSATKDSTINQTIAPPPPNNQFEDMLTAPLNLTNEQLKDRAVCFELFRKSYRKSQALEDNKELLREKYALAKNMGAVVNNSRNEINRIKNKIEDLRKERALQGFLDGENAVIKHPEEDKLTNEIEKHKKMYKDKYAELKDIKSEIENIQSLLERNHQKLQKDFEKWLQIILNQNSYTTAPPPQKTLKESQRTNLDLSRTSNSSRTRSSQLDPDVERNLAAFYKARDEIHKQTN